MPPVLSGIVCTVLSSVTWMDVPSINRTSADPFLAGVHALQRMARMPQALRGMSSLGAMAVHEIRGGQVHYRPTKGKRATSRRASSLVVGRLHIMRLECLAIASAAALASQCAHPPPARD